MTSLPKSYDPKEAESRWQQHWLAEGTYHFKDDQPREKTFVVDTPPPTVSGVLHMGHIFSYTQADFIARFQRMSGKDVFYPMGFDDNGLPTERLVEKIKEKKASQYESREAFIADCREVVKSAEEEFRRLFRSVALSVDWRQEYQTVSDEVCALSQASFLDLIQKGEVYRDFRPTYWDWVDQTAIAQAEIENKELPGVMNEIEFVILSECEGSPSSAGGPSPAAQDDKIVIMTTRPELLGACVAVMYHPEDPNASRYKGKHAITPLFGVKVPMIADEAVERDKGTGLVMCCTFGDDTDKEWWRKYKLPTIHLLGKDGRLNLENVDGGRWAVSGEADTIHHSPSTVHQLHGLKPKQANAKIIELLQAEGKLLKQTPMTHTVKCAERSGTPIEIIPTHQWFVRITDKKEALKAKGAQCNWHPEFMKLRLDQWIDGLKEDWCISRQRFFGVPFPVWYSKRAGEEGKAMYASPDQLPVNPLVDTPKGYTRDEVEPDKDVMDTWATSSLTPQIGAMMGNGQRATSNGNPLSPLASCLLPSKLFPADVRPQAHEIIRTWAFYTIVKSYLHTCHPERSEGSPNSLGDSSATPQNDSGVAPWSNLMISGWCLAADKTKMSKSKGNVVTPVALIEEKGADAVRYWASTSRLGADTAFSEDVLKIGRKLVTKLWNASNFVAYQLPGWDNQNAPPIESLKTHITEVLDRWILSRLHKTIRESTIQFSTFEYCDARVAIEKFFWNDFCDNYLELIKARVYGSEENIDSIAKAKKESGGQRSGLYTLYYSLDAVLRLFAPFVPHVTEEIYTHLFAGKGSVHARGQWPDASAYPLNDAAEKSGIAVVAALNAIRKAKSEAGVSIKFPVERVVMPAAEFALVEPALADLKAAGNAAEITTGAAWQITLAPAADVKEA